MLRCTVAVGLALLAGNVAAQLSGTASLVSNYRFRGISLSDDRPAAQVGLAYDAAQGWYAGTFASTVEFTATRGLQAVPYIGYASRAEGGLGWEVGADYSAFTGDARGYNYPELYAGLAGENISGRVYYSNRYFGQSSGALYAEVNGSQLLRDRVRLLAHAGFLRNNHAISYNGERARLFDARVGIGVDLDYVNVELSWVGISSSGEGYRINRVGNRSGPVLTLLRSF